jgi:hypothetical protein
MSRRVDPERIDAARHAATLGRLIGEGVTAETALEWIAALGGEGARRGLRCGAEYWDAAWAWIAQERQTRGRPS